MIPLQPTLLFIAIGFASGFMSGMVGIGGGSVRIPLLNIAGLPLISAFGINFIVIPFSSAVGAFSQRKKIVRNIILYAVLGGVIGEIIGAVLVGFIPTLALAILFVTICAGIVVGMFSDRLVPALKDHLEPSHTNVFGASFLVSFITGLRGGSGGSLYPAVFKGVGFETHQAIATSLFVTIFTAAGAIAIYWPRGDILWLPALFVVLGSMLGARIGSTLSLKTKPLALEIGLSAFILFLAALTLYKAL